ncbi:MAG: hypothetical protein ACXQTZ_05220 [Candidatus Alkanophagales archaeon]
MVISFRVPKELKRAMREMDVNWSEELRRFVETRVREYKEESAGGDRCDARTPPACGGEGDGEKLCKR